MTNVLSACQVSSGNDIRGRRRKKIIYFRVLSVFKRKHLKHNKNYIRIRSSLSDDWSEPKARRWSPLHRPSRAKLVLVNSQEIIVLT